MHFALKLSKFHKFFQHIALTMISASSGMALYRDELHWSISMRGMASICWRNTLVCLETEKKKKREICLMLNIQYVIVQDFANFFPGNLTFSIQILLSLLSLSTFEVILVILIHALQNGFRCGLFTVTSLFLFVIF